MKTLLKKSIKQLLNTAWSMKKTYQYNRIIYYHSVHPENKRSHTPEVFRSHLMWLKKNGYKSLLVSDVPDELKKIRQPLQPWVAISFDDGYKDNLEFALPILKQEGFQATFFIVSGVVRKTRCINSSQGNMLYEDRPMLREEDVKALFDAGMEIGSHSESHQLMDSVCHSDSKKCLDEFVHSKDKLERIIGSEITSFSYPNGQKGAFSKQTRKLLEKAGYRIGLTTMWGPPTAEDDLLELPRCEISVRDSYDDFCAKMVGFRDYNKYICRWFQRAKIWDSN